MERSVPDTLASLVIRLAIDCDKHGKTLSEHELMERIAVSGVTLHDSSKTTRLIVNAAYLEAVDNGNDILAGMIAESFTDDRGYPLIAWLS